jgi:hypothetical protein
VDHQAMPTTAAPITAPTMTAVMTRTGRSSTTLLVPATAELAVSDQQCRIPGDRAQKRMGSTVGLHAGRLRFVLAAGRVEPAVRFASPTCRRCSGGHSRRAISRPGRSPPRGRSGGDSAAGREQGEEKVFQKPT